MKAIEHARALVTALGETPGERWIVKAPGEVERGIPSSEQHVAYLVIEGPGDADYPMTVRMYTDREMMRLSLYYPRHPGTGEMIVSQDYTDKERWPTCGYSRDRLTRNAVARVARFLANSVTRAAWARAVRIVQWQLAREAEEEAMRLEVMDALGGLPRAEVRGKAIHLRIHDARGRESGWGDVIVSAESEDARLPARAKVTLQQVPYPVALAMLRAMVAAEQEQA